MGNLSWRTIHNQALVSLHDTLWHSVKLAFRKEKHVVCAYTDPFEGFWTETVAQMEDIQLQQNVGKYILNLEYVCSVDFIKYDYHLGCKCTIALTSHRSVMADNHLYFYETQMKCNLVKNLPTGGAWHLTDHDCQFRKTARTIRPQATFCDLPHNEHATGHFSAKKTKSGSIFTNN